MNKTICLGTVKSYTIHLLYAHLFWDVLLVSMKKMSTLVIEENICNNIINDNNI